jgi:hypothetical protein
MTLRRHGGRLVGIIAISLVLLMLFAGLLLSRDRLPDAASELEKLARYPNGQNVSFQSNRNCWEDAPVFTLEGNGGVMGPNVRCNGLAVSFVTRDDPAEIQRFYNDKLKTEGWARVVSQQQALEFVRLEPYSRGLRLTGYPRENPWIPWLEVDRENGLLHVAITTSTDVPDSLQGSSSITQVRLELHIWY